MSGWAWAGKNLRRALAALLVAMLCAAMAGCWDRQELENLAFVVYLGLDKGPDHDLLVTFRIIRPAGYSGGQGVGGGGTGSGGGGGGGTAQTSVITTVEAPSIMSAESIAATYVRRRLVLDQSEAVIVGLPLAEQGVIPYLDELVRHREIRRSTLFLVAAPDAEVAFKSAKPPLDVDPEAFLLNMGLVQQTEGWVPKSTLQAFLAGLETPMQGGPVTMLAAYSPQALSSELKTTPPSPSRSPLAVPPQDVPRSGATNPVNAFGAAAFRRARMVGTLTAQQTVILNMLTGNLRRTLLTIPDPFHPSFNDELIVTARQGPKVSIDVRSAIPDIQVTVPLDAAVEFDGGYVDYAINAKNIQTLQHAVNQTLERQAEALIAQAQTQWKSDIFGFGNHARGKFRTDAQMVHYDWNAVFPQARTVVTFQVRLEQTGPQLQPPVPNPASPNNPAGVESGGGR